MQNLENEFTFCDDFIKSSSKCENYQDSVEIKYALLVKVMETKEYFFLYQQANQAYIVDKSTMTEEDAVLVQEKLKENVKKYIVCKY